MILLDKLGLLCFLHKQAHFLCFWISLCFLICVCCSVSTAKSVKESEMEIGVCGTVTTTNNDTIILRGGEPLSRDEFDKIHIMKLKGAVVSPAKDYDYIVQICGFTAFGPVFDSPDGCLGSESNLMECRHISETGTVLEEYYFNDLYNASSISCGRDRQKKGCQLDCDEKRDSAVPGIMIEWEEDDCALLYQENACNDCYFSPIRLKTSMNEFRTNYSLHISSILVREQCIVEQNVSALRRICGLEDSQTTVVYTEKESNAGVQSAFQIDPEVFTCTCGLDVSSTSTDALTSISTSTLTDISPSISTSTTNSPNKSEPASNIVLRVLSSSLIVVISTTISFLLYKFRHRLRCRRLCGPIKASTASSEKSNETEFTEFSGVESLEFSNIIKSPFDLTHELSRDHFQLGKKLGGGHFGEVFLGTLQVGIKTLKKNAVDEELSLKSLQHEINILSHLGSHENVVRFLGASVKDLEKGEIYLITEYCQNASLKDYLKKVVKPRVMEKVREALMTKLHLSEDGYPGGLEAIDVGAAGDTAHDLKELDPSILRLFLQWSEEIASGMQYVTFKKVVHVDLAARNILLTHSLRAKIGDFGLSRKIYIKKYVSHRKGGHDDQHDFLCPIPWVAPESFTKNKYSPKSDIWSYGVTLWEMFTLGRDPYDEKLSMEEILAAVIQGKGLSRPAFATEDVYSKLNECWRENPEDRPSFQDLREYFLLAKKQMNENELITVTVRKDELEDEPC